MAILLHVTPRRNLASIYRKGIDPAFARGPLAACWLCSGSLRAWAVEHVAARYDLPTSEVAVLRVSVPRPWLTRRRKGVWTCPRVVRDIRSVAVVSFAA